MPKRKPRNLRDIVKKYATLERLEAVLRNKPFAFDQDDVPLVYALGNKRRKEQKTYDYSAESMIFLFYVHRDLRERNVAEDKLAKLDEIIKIYGEVYTTQEGIGQGGRIPEVEDKFKELLECPQRNNIAESIRSCASQFRSAETKFIDTLDAHTVKQLEWSRHAYRNAIDHPYLTMEAVLRRL